MNIAFVGNSLSSGGAQKMLAFAISCVNDLADNIYIVLEKDDDIMHKIPENAIICHLRNEPQIAIGKSRIRTIISYSKQLKAILRTNNIGISCSFGQYYTLVNVLAAKGTNTKTIGSERRAPQELNAVWKILSTCAYRNCDRMSFQIQGARDFYPMIPEKKVSIIPNPYISSGEVNSVKSHDRQKKIVMGAARLEYEKGFDVGIKMMSRIRRDFPDYVLEIYGAGDSEALYGDILDEFKVRNVVKFKGLSSNFIEDIYDAKCFLLPSRSEGIPNVLLEAMGAGMPCVASDCPPGGPRMLLGNNERGLLVPMNDIDATYEAVHKLITDELLSDRLSNNAQNVKTIYSVENIRKLWRQCFQKVGLD